MKAFHRLLVAILDLKPGARVLEPSAGLGRLLDSLQPYEPGEVVAVDIAPQCTGELFRQDRPGVTIKQRDFLDTTPEELGVFDAIAMNPPFHLRADILHIRHALKFLKPGGTLAAICMAGEIRRKALQPLTDYWADIAPSTFRESGTDINATLIRCPYENGKQKRNYETSD